MNVIDNDVVVVFVVNFLINSLSLALYVFLLFYPHWQGRGWGLVVSHDDRPAYGLLLFSNFDFLNLVTVLTNHYFLLNTLAFFLLLNTIVLTVAVSIVVFSTVC